MADLRQMFETHPNRPSVELDAVQRTVEALMACAQTCIACADACISEGQCDHLKRCIRLNLDCADICQTTLRSLTRQSSPDWELWRSLVETCVLACRTCGQECRNHAARHEHCRICADTCHNCEQTCQWMLRALAAHT